MRLIYRLALSCLLSGYAAGANAPTPQKLVDEYLQAQGGANAVALIHTEIIAGNLTEESTGRSGSWSAIARAPDRFHTEIIAGPDRTVEAYNGMSAWGQEVAGTGASPAGPHTLTGDAATQTEAAARDWNERLADVKKSKLSLEFVGSEKVRDRDTWHVRVSSGPGRTRELYFDAGTHLIAREVLPNAQLDYDDYRPVQGIQTPYRIELRRGGHTYRIAVTRAEFNSPVDDSVFNFPRTSTAPLPDIALLMREVTKNQKAIEELQKQYTCHLTEEQEITGSKSRVTTMVREYEVFKIAGEEVRRLLAKDGVPLAPNEKKKEDDRFNREFDKTTKQAAEAARNPKKQAQQDAQEDAQLSDFLRVVRFTDARRERFRGQDVIAVDFGPNPDYKPREMIENIIHQMSGVFWIDEQARDIARLEAHIDANIRIGGGLAGALDKGSSFVFEQAKVNNEVWLPIYDEFHFGGRLLVLKVKANQIDRYTDYKKFHADSTFVPDAN